MHSRSGSSPLTRGTRFRSNNTFSPIGIIPAHAGNTYVLSICTLAVQDHPRSRGEHRPSMSFQSFTIGSSPLTRGTLAARLGNFLLPRIIPAHAGNTEWLIIFGHTLKDHPRSRGEHGSENDTSQQLQGSSPLTRGTLFRRLLIVAIVGIIPAHAGNT